MTAHNIKASVSGNKLTLIIDLDNPNIEPNQKGTADKVATCFWNDKIKGLPEGYTMSMAMMRPLAVKKNKKVSKPTRDESNEKVKTKDFVKNKIKSSKNAKPENKATKPKANNKLKAQEAKPAAKSSKKASNEEDSGNETEFFPNKSRAAA